MVETTFINLKSDRQEEILQVAYREFAEKGYSAASLSDIIKNLGLAKGSFYRYFKGKKALFSYLIHDSTQRRLQNLDALVEKEKEDFFVLIRQNFLAKVRFDLQQPTVAAFLYRIMQEKNNPEVADLLQELYKGIVAKTKSLVELPNYKAQLNGLDSALIAYHIFNTQLWLYEYIAEKFGINYETKIATNQPILDLGEHDIESVLDQVIGLLKSGISK